MPEKKKEKNYEAAYEPMLNLEVRLYVWEKGKAEYNELLDKVSGRRLYGYESWNTIVEPVQAPDGGFFRALRVNNKHDHRYLVHELYHMVTAIKETYGLCEECGAYLMWRLDNELVV